MLLCTHTTLLQQSARLPQEIKLQLQYADEKHLAYQARVSIETIVLLALASRFACDGKCRALGHFNISVKPAGQQAALTSRTVATSTTCTEPQPALTHVTLAQQFAPLPQEPKSQLQYTYHTYHVYQAHMVAQTSVLLPANCWDLPAGLPVDAKHGVHYTM
jgi:hypothetical protein